MNSDYTLWLILLIGAGMLAMKIVLVGNWIVRFRQMNDRERETAIKSLRLDEDASGWG